MPRAGRPGGPAARRCAARPPSRPTRGGPAIYHRAGRPASGPTRGGAAACRRADPSSSGPTRGGPAARRRAARPRSQPTREGPARAPHPLPAPLRPPRAPSLPPGPMAPARSPSAEGRRAGTPRALPERRGGTLARPTRASRRPSRGPRRLRTTPAPRIVHLPPVRITMNNTNCCLSDPWLSPWLRQCLPAPNPRRRAPLRRPPIAAPSPARPCLPPYGRTGHSPSDRLRVVAWGSGGMFSRHAARRDDPRAAGDVAGEVREDIRWWMSVTDPWDGR